jgi:uncharacterized surface protein with fasciclin (FAS1) repeats
MKMQTLFKAFLLAFMVLSLVACGSDDDDDNGQAAKMDIVETAEDNGNFTTLLAALEAAGLDDDLAGAGPFTVFAPTDDAFDALEAANPGTLAFLLDPANQAVLIDILQFHVIQGKVMAADAIALDGTSAEMLNGSLLRIDVVNSSVVLSLNGNREATVTVTDIEASNGVIHVIDAVLDPSDSVETIVQTAVDNGSFTLLAAALTKAELVDALEGAGPFTVFAPTDTAFNAIGINTAADLPDKATLTPLLTYHVYDGSVLAAAAIALDGSDVTMLSGDAMSIDVVSNEVILNQGGGREAKVTLTDVLSSNGVIHVIDTVLDPADAP